VKKALTGHRRSVEYRQGKHPVSQNKKVLIDPKNIVKYFKTAAGIESLVN